MNRNQKTVLIGGLILLLGIFSFFTPYNHIRYKGNDGEIVRGTSYSNIIFPPNASDGKPYNTKASGRYSKYLQDKGEHIQTNERQWTTDANTVEIDYPKLILFTILIFIITSCFIAVLKSSKKDNKKD